MPLNDKDIPDGWFLLYCPLCLSSVTWTKKVLQSYVIFDEWFPTLDWAVSQSDHNLDLHKENK